METTLFIMQKCYRLKVHLIFIAFYDDLPNLQSIHIGEGCFYSMKTNVDIVNLPSLDSIVVKKNSMMNVESLKICNNEQLKTIHFENGDMIENNSVLSSNCSFQNLQNLQLTSTLFTIRLSSDLPSLQSFKTGKHSFTHLYTFSFSRIFDCLLIIERTSFSSFTGI